MYPRNAASPEPIAIGAVVQISDGAVQTSGVTVRIKPVGVAESNGAGTTAYSTDGVVLYTPTQAETNYTSFVLIASKSGCFPASQTVITSESTVSGRVYVQTIATTQINAVADQVWDEAYSQHTTAGTFGKLMDTLRKANTVLEGTVLASPTPTTTVFRLSGIDYPTGALEHSVLWMSSGASQEQNSPILTTVNNGDGTVTVTLEEALVTAPTAGDTVLIDPTSHVHAIADIQSGLSTLTAAQVNAEVLDVLQTDLFGELAAVPGASSSLKDKIAFLFMLARNKVTQTSSTQTLFADNTTTPVAAATTSDVGGTFTRGEFA